MSNGWVKSPLYVDTRLVAAPLDPNALTDNDLPELCFRMHVIMDSIEFSRAEGRLLPRDLFDAIDTLESDLRHKGSNSLRQWSDWIIKFGDYYELDGSGPIRLRPESFADSAKQFGRAELPFGNPFAQNGSQ